MSKRVSLSIKLIELFGRAPREKGSALEDFHHDLAKSLQTVLAEIVLEKVAYLWQKHQDATKYSLNSGTLAHALPVFGEIYHQQAVLG